MKNGMIIGGIVILVSLSGAAIYTFGFPEGKTTTIDKDINTYSVENQTNQTTPQQITTGYYRGFIEYDPEGNITISEDCITFTRMYRHYEGAVYKEFIPGYFGQNFMHTFQFTITSGNKNLEGTIMPWAVSNEVRSVHDFLYPENCTNESRGDREGLTLTFQPRESPDAAHLNRTGPRGFLSDWELGTRIQYVLPSDDVYNKTIYCVISRNNGTLSALFFRDDAHTDLITSVSIKTGLESYKIIQAFGARGSRECEPYWTPYAFVSGYIENLILEK